MAIMMHCPQTNAHKPRQWIPQRLDPIVRFFFHENATVDHAPDKPPESVHRSSPLASQGLVAPPGLHGFQSQGKGWGWVRWPAKKTKKLPRKKWQYIVRHHLWGWGGGGQGYHVFTMFSIWTQAGDRNPRA